MIIKEFSNKYDVFRLDESNIDGIYTLCSGNPLYYEYCPPFVSREGILEDMEGLPHGKTMKDKYFVGFYKNNMLIAIMDLIDGYPEKNIAFIGFYMIDSSIQKLGIGSDIISYFCDYLGSQGYTAVRLAWVKGNPQAECFWLRNQFQPMKETKGSIGKQVILAERKLSY